MRRIFLAAVLAIVVCCVLGVAIWIFTGGTEVGDHRAAFRGVEPAAADPGSDPEPEEIVHVPADGSVRAGPGTLSISGKVVDEAGRPVPYAEVLLLRSTRTLETALSDSRFDDEDRAEREVRERATLVDRLANSFPGVRANAGGLFRFDGLAAGDYRAAAVIDAVAIERGAPPSLIPATTAIVTVDDRSPRREETLVMNVGAAIRGVVISSTGEPISGAQLVASWDAETLDIVFLRDADSETLLRVLLAHDSVEVTSERDGSFFIGGLLPGEFGLRAGADGYARKIVRDVPSDGPQVQVVLEPELVVRGSVVDEVGAGIAAAGVELTMLTSEVDDMRSVLRESLGGGDRRGSGGREGFGRRGGSRGRGSRWGRGDERRGDSSPGIRVGAVSDADGFFEVRGLAEGSYRAEARREGFQKGLEPVFAVRQGSTDEDRTIRIELVPGRLISGIVLDETGRGIAAARVRLRREGDLPRQGDGGGATAEDDDDDRDRRGRGRGRAGREGGDRAEDERQGGDDRDGRRDGAGRGGRGRERGDGGRGDRGRGDRGRGDRGRDERGGFDVRSLVERVARARERESFQTTTDRTGRFAVDTLPEGLYRVEARAEGHLSSSVRRVPTDSDPVEIGLEGGKSIRGRVVDRASSKGVSRAVVVVEAVVDPRGDGTEPTSDDKEGERGRRGRRDERDRGRGGERLQFARTDEEGRFVVDDLRDGLYSVRVHATGYLGSEKQSAEAGGDQDVEIGIERSGVVSGRVVDVAGDGVPGVRCVLAIVEDGGSGGGGADGDGRGRGGRGRGGRGRGDGGRGGGGREGRSGFLGSAVMTDADGEYSLAANRPVLVKVVVRGGAYLPAESETVSIDDARESIEDVEVVLERAATVAGVVTGADGPVARATVEVRPFVEDEAQPAGSEAAEGTERRSREELRERVRRRMEQTRGGVSARTDAVGRYRARGLTAGRYRIRVRVAAHIDYTGEPFPLALGDEVERDVRLEPELTIVGTVTAADGTPVEGAMISVSEMNADEATSQGARRRGGRGFAELFGRGGRGRRGTTDVRGAYRIGKLDHGSYEVQVSARGFASAFAVDIRAPSQKVDFALEPLLSVSGNAIGATTALAVPAFRLRFATAEDTTSSRRGDSGSARWRGFEDPDGAFFVDKLPPGDYTLQIDAPGYLPVTDLKIRLLSQTPVTGLRVAVPEGGAIAGVVVNTRGQPIVGARVEAWIESVDEASGEASFGRYSSSLGSSRQERRTSGRRGLLGRGEDAAGGGDSGRGSERGRGRGRTDGEAGGQSRTRRSRSGETASLDDGSFLLRGLPDGVFRVRVTHSELIPAEDGPHRVVTTEDGTSTLTDVRITLKDGATVRGRVTGLAAGEGTRTTVTISGGIERKSAIVDSRGAFQLRGIAPGSYDLEAMSSTPERSRGRRGGSRSGGEAENRVSVKVKVEVSEKARVVDDVRIAFE